MGILKKARHSKIDVFVKFESAINLEISGQIKKKPGFLLFDACNEHNTSLECSSVIDSNTSISLIPV